MAVGGAFHGCNKASHEGGNYIREEYKRALIVSNKSEFVNLITYDRRKVFSSF